MLKVSKGAPISLSTPTTAAEKPHWGMDGLPFMNSITRPRAMVSAILCLSGSVTVAPYLFASVFFGSLGGQRQRVDGGARPVHGLAQRGVDQPVAIDEALVGEGRRHDGGREVVAAAGGVDDAYLGVGERDADAGSDVFGRHGRCCRPI